jgi:hypothetical protein
MSAVLQQLLEIQAQVNELIAQMQMSEPKAPNAPRKVKRAKSLANEDKESLKESGSDAAKAIEAAASPEKTKRVLSPEHLAKLKAGREVAKARKAAEQAASAMINLNTNA